MGYRSDTTNRLNKGALQISEFLLRLRAPREAPTLLHYVASEILFSSQTSGHHLVPQGEIFQPREGPVFEFHYTWVKQQDKSFQPPGNEGRLRRRTKSKLSVKGGETWEGIYHPLKILDMSHME